MELVQIEVGGPELFERLVQLIFGFVAQPLCRFTGQKDLVAVGLQGRPQALLGIAVGRGHIEVVDPPVHGLGDDAAGRIGFHVHEHDAAFADAEKSASKPPTSAAAFISRFRKAIASGSPSPRTSGTTPRVTVTFG